MLKMTRKSTRPVGQALKQLSREVKSKRRGILGKAGAMMVAQTKRRWERGIDPGGNAWTPLSPGTIAAKGHDKPLFLTGALNRSIQVLSLSHEQVSVGPTMGEQKKGITHQFGHPVLEETVTVPAHTRSAHTRVQRGKAVHVRETHVQAYTQTVRKPPVPARPFLGFSPGSQQGDKDLEQLREMIVSELERSK